jgi:ABC-2 type transport system ATP-binding protein
VSARGASPGATCAADPARGATRAVNDSDARAAAGPGILAPITAEGAGMTAIIETDRLTKSYGTFRGIVDVDLAVNEGEIFGFLGPNGAGKTTTIRVLLDLIRPTSGSARVFGIEAAADPVAIHRRIGYLPGEWNLYDRLTGGETIRFFANLRRGVDPEYTRQLVERLDLDPSRRFREYSRGNKQKVGLIVALQHRPDLLILDEPTSGLDPLVQQTFNELLFEAKAEGRTVFLSSHIISEVERTCDRVAIIREGRIVRVDTVEGVRNLAAHEVELRFAAPVPAAAFQVIDGVRDVVEEGRTLRMLVTGPIAPIVRLAAQYELVDFVSREPSLEEVFLSEYASRDTTRAGAAR